MAAVTLSPTSALLTYEDYMAEPEVEGRYDIVDGMRILMPGATYRHQRIAKNIAVALTAFEKQSGIGVVVFAPYDVLIRRRPKLQTRQPDLLFISHARLAQGGGIPEVGPLEVAPELVVEIVSSSEMQRILDDKLTDYIFIGVEECWVVRPEARTIEVLQMTQGSSQSVATYDDMQAVSSVVFPALTVSVGDCFAV